MEDEKIRRMSKLELLLLQQIQLYNKQAWQKWEEDDTPKSQTEHLVTGPFEVEYEFCSWRGFKADFAWTEDRLLVEVEGTTYDSNKGRHTSRSGYETDCLKYSLAACLGWRIIRVTRKMIESGLALTLILNALGLEPDGKLEIATALPPKEKKNVRRKVSSVRPRLNPKGGISTGARSRANKP